MLKRPKRPTYARDGARTRTPGHAVAKAAAPRHAFRQGAPGKFKVLVSFRRLFFLALAALLVAAALYLVVQSVIGLSLFN